MYHVRIGQSHIHIDVIHLSLSRTSHYEHYSDIEGGHTC